MGELLLEVAPTFTRKHEPNLKEISMDKLPSLLCPNVCDEEQALFFDIDAEAK